MKHINLKKILYTLLGGVMGIALFVSLGGMSQAAQGSNPPGQTTPLYTQAGGPMNVAQFQMSRKNLDRDEPDDPNSISVLKQGNEEAIFRLVGTSVFSNILSFGRARFDRLAIGYDKPFLFNSGDTALQVNGTITIKGLADANRTDPVPACINDFGVIELCDGNGTPAPTAVNGKCGKTHYDCVDGTSVDNKEISTEYTWVCQGSNGGTDDQCTEKKSGGKGTYMTCRDSGLWELKGGDCAIDYDKTRQYGANDIVCVDVSIASSMDEKDPDNNCGKGESEKKGELMFCTDKGVWTDNKKECSSINYDAKKSYGEKDTACVDQEQVVNLNEKDPDNNCGKGESEKKGELMFCTDKGVWTDNKKECSSINYDAKKSYGEKDTACVDQEQVVNLNEKDPDNNCGK